MVEPSPIIAHLRSASGPDLTGFALDFARYAGGDLLWCAYVPEGVRGWFGRFADSRDPSRSPASQFRIARLFASPSSDDLKFLLDRIEARRAAAGDQTTPRREARSPDVERVGDEIDQGRLHVAGLLLDIHHVPTFVRQLRTGAGAPSEAARPRWTRLDPAGSTSVNLSSILRRGRAANLHVLVATLESAEAKPGEKSPRRDDAAAVLGTIDAAADLTLRVGRTSAGPDCSRRFDLQVCRSRYLELPAGPDTPGTSWDELLAAIRPQRRWAERLMLAYPRDELLGLGDLRESAASWTDPTQEEFAELAERRGWTVARASSDQDRGEHWDLCVERGGERYRIDVKARSKVRRSDATPQDTWHWVELRGIVDDGWLFGGHSDLIAFQTSDSFLLVRRADLAEHVRHHVDPEDLVSDPRRAEYRVYHRRDTTDYGRTRPTGTDRGLLTLVPMGRLRRLAWQEWASGVRDVIAPQ